MAGDTANGESADHSSLDLLAVRLRRLEFLLSGSSDVDGIPDGVTKPANHDESVLGRLKTLQSGLDKLRKKGGVAGEMIRDVEGLCACYTCANDEILTKAQTINTPSYENKIAACLWTTHLHKRRSSSPMPHYILRPPRGCRLSKRSRYRRSRAAPNWWN